MSIILKIKLHYQVDTSYRTEHTLALAMPSKKYCTSNILLLYARVLRSRDNG